MPTAAGSQQFRKKSRKLQGRNMFERKYSFFHHCLLSCRYVMFQKQYFKLTKVGGGAQAVIRGSAAPLAPL